MKELVEGCKVELQKQAKTKFEFFERMIEEVQENSGIKTQEKIDGNMKILQTNFDLKMQNFEQNLQKVQQHFLQREKKSNFPSTDQGADDEIERKNTNQILMDQLERELSQAPSKDQGADEKCVQNWKRLKALTIDDIKKYWHKAELEVKRPEDEQAEEFDLSECEFTTWETNDSLYIGTRKKDSDRPIKHGVVREIMADGNIFEATFKNGQMHGIGRVINKERILVQIFSSEKHGDRSLGLVLKQFRIGESTKRADLFLYYENGKKELLEDYQAE